MNIIRHALRLNVGFLVNQSVGFSRKFLFDYPFLKIQPDLDLKNLSGTAQVTRTPQGLLVQTKMSATVVAECVRCLEEFEQPLSINFTELYAFSQRSVSESGLILPESGMIDLGPLVREYMLLEIPINPLCRPDCKGICPICGEILNDTPHEHVEDEIDPRMAILQELLDKKKE